MLEMTAWHCHWIINKSFCVLNCCPKDKGCLVLEIRVIYVVWSLNWLVRVLLNSTYIFIFMVPTAEDIISGTQHIRKRCTVLSTRVEITQKTGAVTVGDAAALFHHAQCFPATTLEKKNQKKKKPHTHKYVGKFRYLKSVKIFIHGIFFSVNLPKCCKVCLLYCFPDLHSVFNSQMWYVEFWKKECWCKTRVYTTKCNLFFWIYCLFVEYLAQLVGLISKKKPSSKKKV